ncbi:GntR family transcriptional regulator [Methylobacterium sp. J-068]|nr:GntR family transcriptional regulator [Methylobacterium sp. J-068]MCJ2035903.1 GntR family transcriptional regulator [Methylobacterium sp. J-068]
MLDSTLDSATDAGAATQPVPPAGVAWGASLHGALLAHLRDYIVEGNLAPGARVPERALCERFGVSRTPLREALKVLASEGLIELLPNRGARVRQLGADEMVALFDVMGGLEALAGRLACEKITESGYAVIERLHHDMYAAYLRRDLHGYFTCNQAIHDRIVEAADNEPLATTYANFAGRLRRVRYAANLDKNRDRWGEAMREHEEILDALRRRAGPELSDILFRHLRNKRKAAAVQETVVQGTTVQGTTVQEAAVQETGAKETAAPAPAVG